MYRPKPKLSVSIAATQRPSLSLSIKSPGPLQQVHSPGPRSPLPPSPAPSKRFSTLQVPNYVNSCSAKSILKKSSGTTGVAAGKKIQFQGSPTVHCVTPIENKEEYYGNYRKLSREERRWVVRGD
ncbi:hypothetical protein BDW74DRAFT_180865 [Aspergillus multicolor]|uniref:uncharacterized protein n=1 Tax=Aspergillus multicolor TaxID=41759 RepID=UPI003CCDAF7D